MMMLPIANWARRWQRLIRSVVTMCRWKGLRTGTLRVGETASKAPALYSYPFALLNTWTLSTEVQFAVPLNWGSLVNEWPGIRSARTTGWRPHSDCGDRLTSAAQSKSYCNGDPPILGQWGDCHQSWTYDEDRKVCPVRLLSQKRILSPAKNGRHTQTYLSNVSRFHVL